VEVGGPGFSHRRRSPRSAGRSTSSRAKHKGGGSPCELSAGDRVRGTALEISAGGGQQHGSCGGAAAAAASGWRGGGRCAIEDFDVVECEDGACSCKPKLDLKGVNLGKDDGV